MNNFNILPNVLFLAKCILENTFSRMYYSMNVFSRVHSQNRGSKHRLILFCPHTFHICSSVNFCVVHFVFNTCMLYSRIKFKLFVYIFIFFKVL